MNGTINIKICWTAIEASRMLHGGTRVQHQ
jgi:hypothetical protein